MKLLKQMSKNGKKSYLNVCTTKGNHSVKTTNKKCYMKLKVVSSYFFVHEYYVKKPDKSK